MRAMSLEEFCRRVGSIMAGATGAETPARVAALMPALLRTADLLSPEQLAPPATGYGRHDVFVCPSEMFSVIAAVWPAGIVSPIHDHLTWCTFGVYRGVIQETRYAPAHADAECTHAVRVGVYERVAGSVGHLPVDAPDIHSIHNPGDMAAVSIHVYGGDSRKMGANMERVYSLEA